MMISFIKYPVTTLGPGKRIGIWTAGCKKNCKNCMSKVNHEFDEKLQQSIDDIIHIIKNYQKNNIVDGITISGGEPFLQNDLKELILKIKELGINDILIYTGFLLSEIINHDEILKNISVLVDGPYIDELNDNLPLRGSSNQNVYILNNKYEKIYLEYLKKPREFELNIDNQKVMIIGMLPKNGKTYIDEIMKINN